MINVTEICQQSDLKGSEIYPQQERLPHQNAAHTITKVCLLRFSMHNTYRRLINWYQARQMTLSSKRNEMIVFIIYLNAFYIIFQFMYIQYTLEFVIFT